MTTQAQAVKNLIDTIKTMDSINIEAAWDDFKANVISGNFDTDAELAKEAAKPAPAVKTSMTAPSTTTVKPTTRAANTLPEVKTSPAGTGNVKSTTP